MGDQPISGKLAALFGGTHPIRIELLGPGGVRLHNRDCADINVCQCTGTWVTFDPNDGATSLEYNRIIERAAASGRKKSGYEEAAEYIMRRKVLPRVERQESAIEGLDAEDCGGMDPLKFLTGGSATAKVIIREAVARYSLLTGMGSAEDSKN